MRKRDKACFIIGTILIIGAVVLMVFTFSKRNNTDDRPVSTVIYHDDGRGMPIFERRQAMTIEHRHGHYVVLDDNGNVYCSCDTHKEAADEIAEEENN